MRLQFSMLAPLPNKKCTFYLINFTEKTFFFCNMSDLTRIKSQPSKIYEVIERIRCLNKSNVCIRNCFKARDKVFTKTSKIS